MSIASPPNLSDIIDKWLKERYESSVHRYVNYASRMDLYPKIMLCEYCHMFLFSIYDARVFCWFHGASGGITLDANTPDFFDKLEQELSLHRCLNL